ncbi:MAG: adenylate/guanylate cyclase domain-containing protein [Rhodospirillales bacterium]|jgi:adenylate cyclase|nr:adenylate/guanylate cyclase domain-containing protein [Rhodospirillales bacterium]MDP6643254.1 adenylate/guanylate cyclase domain-containing protein [Rhodospirillales bacterium]MDP6840892.1 adenylate/guanylate cyclase domain-containing protein [Rhodospirillales bacterium]|tara:strand:+ start:653 stop:1894 length:1242 start_codon:yes stop_codon:yes gene_type:complete
MNEEVSGAHHGDSLIDAVADWLMGQALGATGFEDLLRECSLRLNAAGVPLWRSTIAFQTLHPLYQAMSLVWYRDSGLQPVDRFPEGVNSLTEEWRQSPQYYLIANGLPFLRRRLTGREAVVDFPMLEDLKGRGATDHLVYVVHFGGAEYAAPGHDGILGAWTTDRPGGFTDEDIRSLMRIQSRLGVACKIVIREQITRNVLGAYLGPDAGQQVLNGQIKLGDGETIHAVIWFSDLRSSSALADELPADQFLALVNDYFACTAGAVIDCGGEVLRFIGDAVLGIFAIRDGGLDEAAACEMALTAAAEAERRLAALNERRTGGGEAAIDFGIGLHVGDVMYGNIGVPERVEFSVTGPAANEAARIETLTKTTDCRMLVSDHFARQVERPWRSLGRHQLRGVGQPMEVFTLDESKK